LKVGSATSPSDKSSTLPKPQFLPMAQPPIALTGSSRISCTRPVTLCAAQVWEAVKATFSSLDSAVHQLVSHYLRTHACTEPYIVATERCLAATHPLYQFLRPHYEHTLRMNAHVRSLCTPLD